MPTGRKSTERYRKIRESKIYDLSKVPDEQIAGVLGCVNQEAAVRFEILVEEHDKLLKKYQVLCSIMEPLAQALLSLKKAIEKDDGGTGYVPYLQEIYALLSQYLEFKTQKQTKHEIKSETA